MSKEYTYAAAFVKSLEKNMIRMSEFKDAAEYELQQFEDFLREKGYEGDSISEMTEREWKSNLETCLSVCGESEAEILILENDFHNIKAVIKAVFSGIEWNELVYEPTDVDAKSLEDAVKTADFSRLCEKYSDICKDALEIYKKAGVQAMEIYLDKERLLKLASKTDGFVRRWAELKALYLDLKIYLSTSGVTETFLEKGLLKNSFIDVDALKNSDESKEEVLYSLGYKKEYDLFSKSKAEFEKYCDDMIMEYLKRAKTSFFDFDAVLGYFEGKKTEIKNVRLIAAFKRSGMEKELLLERLRETYV